MIIMNWYKKAQQEQKLLEKYPYYVDVGHYYNNYREEHGNYKYSLWLSDLSGKNFKRHNIDTPESDYDHPAFTNDLGIANRPVIQGRYDGRTNIVSIVLSHGLSMQFLPNQLINRLYGEFGNDIKIINYSTRPPERVI